MTSSKARIQNYIRQNKISELFEEMMGKLIKDLPASPIHYLATLLQEKEKKIKQIVRDTSSPTKEKKLEVSNNAMLWATAPVMPARKSTSPRVATALSAEESQVDGRKYEKPWLSHTKKSPGKTKAGSKFNLTAPTPDGSGAKPTKSGWSSKTRVSGEKPGDVVDGDDGVDLGLVYAKPKIVGDYHVRVKDDIEEMESELKMSGKTKPGNQASVMSDVTNKKSSSKVSAKEAKRRRLQELRLLAEKSEENKTTSSRPLIKNIDEDDDDALELLENANDLINEGVKNPPKSGFVVSNSSRKAREEIELVLNMSKFFDELGGMEGVSQSQMNEKARNGLAVDDDDDFESASQVTGPRRPVWEAPESEVESTASQMKSAHRSGVGVDAFDIGGLDSGKTGSSKKDKKETKPEKQKPKSSERPKTAPSRTSSRGDLKTPSNNGQETYRVTDAKPSKSPRSRPTTPKGSVVGTGKTSCRVSQSSNLSDAASPGKKTSKSPSKVTKNEDAEDEPDSRPRSSKH